MNIVPFLKFESPKLALCPFGLDAVRSSARVKTSEVKSAHVPFYCKSEELNLAAIPYILISKRAKCFKDKVNR